MDISSSAERVRQEIVRLSHAGLDSRTLGIEAVKRLRKAIPTDVSFFATADPATLLFTSAVRDDVLAHATSQFLEREFLQDDPVKFAQLARRRSPVDSLGMATKGELARSARYREMLSPMDLGDELRAALVVDSKCWGFMCLHRERSSPDFTPAEAALLARLVPHLAEGLRKALLLGGSRATTPQPDGPGLVLLADDLSLVAITPTAEGWLAEVPKSSWPSSLELPDAVYAVAARLLALERGGQTPPDLTPRIRLRTASDRWLVLHASRLRTTGAEGQIAVIFEEARPSEIAPLIVDAYGLTKREGEVTQLVLRGLSTAEAQGNCTSRPTPCAITSRPSSTRSECAAAENWPARSSPSTTDHAWLPARNQTPMDGSPELELQCDLNRLSLSFAFGFSCPRRFEMRS